MRHCSHKSSTVNLQDRSTQYRLHKQRMTSSNHYYRVQNQCRIRCNNHPRCRIQHSLQHYYCNLHRPSRYQHLRTSLVQNKGYRLCRLFCRRNRLCSMRKKDLSRRIRFRYHHTVCKFHNRLKRSPDNQYTRVEGNRNTCLCRKNCIQLDQLLVLRCKCCIHAPLNRSTKGPRRRLHNMDCKYHCPRFPHTPHTLHLRCSRSRRVRKAHTP